MVVSTDKDSDSGTYSVEVTAYIVDNPTIKSTIEFQLSIYCKQSTIDLVIEEQFDFVVKP